MARKNRAVLAAETRTLTCQLTPAECGERGRTASGALMEAERLKAERSEIGRSISALLRDARAAAEVAERGTEPRPVKCEWRPDYAAGVKTLVRTDTGETLETVPLAGDERQLPLVDMPAGDDVPAAAPVPAPAPRRRGRPPRVHIGDATVTPITAAGAAPASMPVHHEYPSA
jgi:hypothetical protein